MIYYESNGAHLFQLRGSVFPKAFFISLPASLISAGMVLLIHKFGLWRLDAEQVMGDNAVWSGFTFLVGFLIVFRTSQAYIRFWEGCTDLHKMGAEWFDACDTLVCFTKLSTADQGATMRFQGILVRLFSMLHAAALAEIEDLGEVDESDVQDRAHNLSKVHAFTLDVLDPDGIDRESLTVLKDSPAKVELIFQWIQQLVVENTKTGVMAVPPPLLTRAFQELASGMVYFQDAMKISTIPFPFPYAQTCDMLLVAHWLLSPFVISCLVTTPWFAAIFCFVQVFTLWSLNVIAIELSNPFGLDANDLDGERMQKVMNLKLRLLLTPSHMRTPDLREGVDPKELMDAFINDQALRGKSMMNVFTSLEEAQELPVGRPWAQALKKSMSLLSMGSMLHHSGSSLSRTSVRGSRNSTRSTRTSIHRASFTSVGELSPRKLAGTPAAGAGGGRWEPLAGQLRPVSLAEPVPEGREELSSAGLKLGTPGAAAGAAGVSVSYPSSGSFFPSQATELEGDFAAAGVGMVEDSLDSPVSSGPGYCPQPVPATSKFMRALQAGMRSREGGDPPQAVQAAGDAPASASGSVPSACRDRGDELAI